MDAKVGTGRKQKKLKVALIVVLVIVLGAGAGVALRWWQSKDSQDNVTPTPALPETVTELQDLRADGDEVTFNAELEDALNDPKTTEETKYLLYIQQGHAAYDKGDFQAAIDAYLKAEAVESTYEIAELLAETYRTAGDAAKAIEYYEKAKTLVSPDNPRGEALKDLLDQYISDVKNGKTGQDEEPPQ